VVEFRLIKLPDDLSDDAIYERITSKSIPPTRTITKLIASAGQRWLDGAGSIFDPRYKRLYPLWVLDLWQRLAVLGSKQKEWEEVYQTLAWVTATPVVSKKFPTPESVLGQRSWGGPIVINLARFTTDEFSALLAKRMITDNVAQCMTQVLQSRLAMDETLQKDHFIAASRFKSVLEIDTAAPHRKRLPQAFQEIEALVKERLSLKVWFPALLVAEKHEIAFPGSGDSIQGFPKPKAIIANIERWTKARFGGKFRCLGNTLAHGTQDDFFSCIPASMSAIAHGVFGDPLWTVENLWMDRVEWFRKLIPDENEVSIKNVNSTTKTYMHM
jgi:hypothetical protein